MAFIGQHQGDRGQYVPLQDIPSATKIPHLETNHYKSSHNQIYGDESKTHAQRRRRRCFPYMNTGFRFGLNVAFATVLLVLLINICLTVVGGSKKSETSDDGFATLGNGTCAEVKRSNIWLHLLINILSTILLGASNYVMQCLSSPTRSEVDKAHRLRVWLDIGVPSIRNLSKISGARRVIWLILGLSSLPLHLFYNSAVFATLGFQQTIQLHVVRPTFLTGSPYYVPRDRYGNPIVRYEPALQEAFDERGSWRRLEPDQCKSVYTPSFVTEYGNALLVTQQNQTSNDNGNSWVTTVFHEPMNYAGDPTIANTELLYPLSYCLAKPAKPHCGLQFSMKVMVAVLICNTIKVLAMATTIWLIKWEPLVTPGDAISSFLQDPDPSTVGRCLSSREDYRSKAPTGSKKDAWEDRLVATYNPQRRLWFATASRRRWLTSYGLCFFALAAVIGLLVYGLLGGTVSSYELLQVGFGEVSASALMMIGQGYRQNAVSMMLLANAPQLVLSILYFWYNGLFTCMLLADEWSGYSRERKALRVSSPEGLQRSTYRLQLPYRFGIPLICVAILLHWLVSQSLFLAFALGYTGSGDRDPSVDISTCGYSSRAIIATIIVSFFVLFVGIGFGFRRLKSGMPVVGSCSAAMSAACHPPEQEQEPWLKDVMWGVVPTPNIDGEEDAIGHCSFTSGSMTTPMAGERYAGQVSDCLLIRASSIPRRQ